MANRVFTVGSLIPGNMDSHFRKIVHVQQPAANPKPQATEKLIIQQGENKFEIQPSKGKLLDVALAQGQTIQYKCRKGTCGQCMVKVIQGQRLSQPNEQEHTKLNKELFNGYRLACQAIIL